MPPLKFNPSYTPGCVYPILLYAGLEAATDLTPRLIHIKANEATLELKWKYKTMQMPPLSIDCFKVHAVSQSADAQAKVQRIDDCNERKAMLTLQLGKTYSLKVSTHYDAGVKADSKEIEYITPTEDKGLDYYSMCG